MPNFTVVNQHCLLLVTDVEAHVNLRILGQSLEGACTTKKSTAAERRGARESTGSSDRARMGLMWVGGRVKLWNKSGSGGGGARMLLQRSRGWKRERNFSAMFSRVNEIRCDGDIDN